MPDAGMAELDEWAELAGAGDRLGASGLPPPDADADMTYEQLCQAHIEAFIQVLRFCLESPKTWC